MIGCYLLSSLCVESVDSLCVAMICVLFDFVSARSVVAQQSCHWEERPLWSIVLCTEESYKLVTGNDWPGDGDSSVVLRKFQDGETRKVIAVTRGIKGCLGGNV